MYSDDEQKQIFSNNLRHYISLKDIPDRQIAQYIGISPQTFNTWTQGKAIPRMPKLQRLASYFNITVSDLVNKPNDSFSTTTIAAHLDTEDLTENELKDVEDYIAFIKSKRKN